MSGPYHGRPTLEADAGLNVVVARWTFSSAVVIQHPAREPLEGQVTCRGHSQCQSLLDEQKGSNCGRRRGAIDGDSKSVPRQHTTGASGGSVFTCLLNKEPGVSQLLSQHRNQSLQLQHLFCALDRSPHTNWKYWEQFTPPPLRPS